VAGIMITNVADTQRDLKMVSDGSDGAIVTWEDRRGGAWYDVYVQRVNFLGAVQWAANGVAVATGATEQDNPVLVSDGTGGAIIAFEVGAGSTNIAAQHIDAAGFPVWAINGITIVGLPDVQDFPRIASDGMGGAIIAWRDFRDGLQYDVYAQRVAGNGAIWWEWDGVRLTSSSGDDETVEICADGAGGIFATWVNDNSDIRAQHVNVDGITQWGSTGIEILGKTGTQWPYEIETDGSGSAVISFYDSSAPIQRAYAQRIDGRHGYWGRPEPDIYSVTDAPGDQGGFARVSWHASQRDVLNQQTITHYSIWRATEAVPGLAPGGGDVVIGAAAVGPDFSGVAYRPDNNAAGEFFWEWVGNQDALYASGYSFNAPTTADSVAGDPAEHYFQIVAHTFNQFYFWPSEPDSGHSVDNLAPAAPLTLTATRAGGDDVLLEWSPGAMEIDLSDYAVYRKTAAGVSPEPLFFLSDTPDTTQIDSTAAETSAFWYIVTARDIHGNQSDPSNEAMVDGSATGVGDRTPPLSALQVLPNAPNPFSKSTTIRFGLPNAADVRIDVYDVAGRRVWSEQRSGMDEGWHQVIFDGRGLNGRALSSGVYFYRVSAGGLNKTRKLVIGR